MIRYEPCLSSPLRRNGVFFTKMVAARVARTHSNADPAVIDGGRLTMGAEDNIKTAQMLYEAFGRGDVQTILNHLTDDIDWSAESASTVAPWYGIRRGKEEVGAFFQDLAAAAEVLEFTPTTFGSNDTEVFAVVRYRASSRATGKTTAMNVHHWFKFRDDKVCFWRGSEDTAQSEAALSD